MRRYIKKQINTAANGAHWPDTGTGSPTNAQTVSDVFGPRPFAAHIPTVGYDYDFHRGIDVNLALGDPVYSPLGGNVSRLHFTHFNWEATSQLDPWSVTAGSGGGALLTPTINTSQYLRLEFDSEGGFGASSFPTTFDRFVNVESGINVGGDWVLELEFQSIAASGDVPVGIAIYDDANDEYVGIDYNGTTVRGFGTDSGGAMAGNGSSATVSSQTWLRIEEVSGTVSWLYGTDGTNWTTLATDATVSFTDTVRPAFRAWIMGDVADSVANDVYLINQVNFVDDDTIGRFGNWAQITNGRERVLLMHMREPVVAIGDFVSIGQQIGTIGKSGFDVRSGRIQSAHSHMELINDNEYFYANGDPVNPLNPDFLPRPNSNQNIVVTLNESDTDPDTVASISLTLDVIRGGTVQDLDLNQVQLVGSTATRTVNFDTRAGLNADPDVPLEAGVYIEAFDFNGSDTEYRVKFYFHTSVVGTFTSYELRDSAGNVITPRAHDLGFDIGFG